MKGNTAGPGDQTQILTVLGELDLATADSLYLRARAAISLGRLLLLDLTDLAFCDACGLSALVRIANDADAAGCRYGLIAPQPPVAKILRITGLDNRLRVFTTIDEALADRPPSPGAPARERRARTARLRIPGRRCGETRALYLPGPAKLFGAWPVTGCQGVKGVKENLLRGG